MLAHQEDNLDLLTKLGEKVKEKDKILSQNTEIREQMLNELFLVSSSVSSFIVRIVVDDRGDDALQRRC